jgi:hypothetical protein
MKDRMTPADPIPVLQESAPRRELPRRAEGLSHELVVNYYRRMRINRTFPLQVEFKRLSSAGGLSPNAVQIRPMIPGAHVTPALREVHLGNSNAVSTFYVTPLARGRLRDAHVGIYQDGRLLQDVRLPMKVVRQRMTWILLLLTFLIPGLIRYFTVGVDLSRSAASTKAAKAAAEGGPQKRMPKADEGDNMAGTMLANMPRGGGDKAAAAKKPEPAPADIPRDTRSPQEKDFAEKMKASMVGMARGQQRAEAPSSQPPTTTPPPSSKQGVPLHKGTLEYEITKNTPEPSELAKDYIADFPNIRQPFAERAQDLYQVVQGFEYNTNAGILEMQPLSRYLFVILLALTVLSWILHTSQRSRRVVPVSGAA